MKIAFLGLGNMGLPMAKNLAAADYEVVGFDVSAVAREKFGATAESISAAVQGAEAVISMLPAGAQVEEVFCGAGGVLDSAAPDTLLIDCSTIDVGTARRVAQAAAAKNQKMLDAPVSGGVGGAEAATLTFMVGGDKAAFTRAKPLLEKMGKNIFHAGASGNGQAAKICNNMLLGVSMIGTCEAFLLAEKLGLDAQTLFDISSTASGQCWSMTSYCPAPGPVPSSPANNDFKAGFAAAMMLKDLRLAQGAAEASDCQTPMGARATELYAQMAERGFADMDFSGIIRLLRGGLG